MWEMDFQAERTARSKSHKFPRVRGIFWEWTTSPTEQERQTKMTRDDWCFITFWHLCFTKFLAFSLARTSYIHRKETL